MRFETINGTLCLMTEPVPLTKDAKFPCVVRLIQDDSPMGKRNLAIHQVRTMDFAEIVVCVHNAYLKTRGNFNNCNPIFYEIIGYPVADGSAEWALYSAMNGKSFVHKDAKQCRIFTMFSERELRVSDGEGETVEYVEVDKFLSDAAKDGWQLYEPKPEAVNPLENGFYAVTTVDPIPFILEWHNDTWLWPDGTMTEFEFPNDIISYVLVERNQSLIDKPLSKPAPAFKVGDWVEWCGDQYMVESAPPQSGGRYNIRSPYEELGISVLPENITRKLSPSEVRVKIGCLEGTVSKSASSLAFFLVPDDTKRQSLIDFYMLDAPTRELVESLLKSQEKGGSDA